MRQGVIQHLFCSPCSTTDRWKPVRVLKGEFACRKIYRVLEYLSGEILFRLVWRVITHGVQLLCRLCQHHHTTHRLHPVFEVLGSGFLDATPCLTDWTLTVALSRPKGKRKDAFQASKPPIAMHLVAMHLIARHLIAMHLTARHLIAMHLTAMHLIAMHLISHAPHGHTPHSHASHSHAPHGHASRRRVFQGRAFHGRTSLADLSRGHALRDKRSLWN